ncbi:hypothetical protein OG507_01460 [Streptomyces sp. NBC_01217]|nr:hypothetical protein OG507_01460 [Streptomyces sp. NBC_01217]
MALSTQDIHALVAEVCRVLRPGGVLVHTVRHTGDAHYGAGTAHGDDIYEHGGCAVHFIPRRLVDPLADGWTLDDSSPQPGSASSTPTPDDGSGARSSAAAPDVRTTPKRAGSCRRPDVGAAQWPVAPLDRPVLRRPCRWPARSGPGPCLRPAVSRAVRSRCS